MKTAQALRFILCLAIIFALGALAGASFSRGAARRERAALPGRIVAVEQEWLRRRQGDYSAKLGLTAEQIEAMRPANERTLRDLRAAREASDREVWRIMGEHYQALHRLLTPEQREIFNRLIEERKAAAAEQP